jgi:hypothetical protein
VVGCQELTAEDAENAEQTRNDLGAIKTNEITIIFSFWVRLMLTALMEASTFQFL